MDARRSTRIAVVLPIMLNGTDFSGLVFKENTWTIGVNKHGAKLSTSYRLAVGDQIMVGNPVLGHSAEARVVRVLEKGRDFEIGVELIEPHDVWGAKIPPDDWNETGPIGAGEYVPAEGDDAAGPYHAGEQNNPEGPGPGEAHANAGTPDGIPNQQHVPSSHGDDLHSHSATHPSASPNQGGEPTTNSPGAQFNSLVEFLRASRSEVQGLLAKTHDIQQKSCDIVQFLFEELHVKLQQELEAASADFGSETHKRVQHEAAVALEAFAKEARARQAALLEDAMAQSRAAREKTEVSLREGLEENRKTLAEFSNAALKEFQNKGVILFEGFRADLQKTLDDLKKTGVDEISEHLQKTAGELTDELRRRAEVGFEILNEQLKVSGSALIEETERQIASLSQSVLEALTKEASDSVHQHVGLGTEALKDVADRTRGNLEIHIQQSIDAFQHRIGELSDAALGKYRSTSEFILQDLQSRLDQAARALQQISAVAAGTDQKHFDG